ncbi:MAG: exosortase A [Rhodoferax sp.]|uniref:exosortase A n=1 Tax=Rhodoferax sp. TaxID=50421 RepID=UPI00271C4079|nr:exosortase A [Rhodoferax sp.]MDO8450856.1 exosortase A [Rhodoferax sp.]
MNSIAANSPIPSTLTRPWRLALPALLLLLAWVLFLYRDTGIAMVTIWARSETFTHGFLVPPIVLWLIWRQRHAIAAQQIQPALWILLPVACTALVWLLGDLAAVNAVTQLALVALLVLSVPAVLGLAVTRQIIFPLGFLFFAVPIGEFVMPQLMAWTADFTVFALRLSGVPVYREGLQFVIPSGNWSVVEACSGVRYLIASITVGTLFAYLNYQSTKRRILFVIVSILVPIVANWLRAYMIVMLGHFSGNKLAVGVDHLVYGWVFFGVVIMLMFIIGARWSEPEKMTSVGASGHTQPLQAVTATRVWAIAACFAAVLALPQIALWVMDQSESAKPASLVAPAALAPEWQAVASPVAGGFKPAFQNPSAEINSTYAHEGRPVGLYLGYYRHQNYTRKLVSSNNSLVPSNDPQWAQVASASHEVAIDGKSVVVRSAELRATDLAAQAVNSRLIVWQIYWINGTLTSSDHLAKAYSAFYRLTGRGDDSAVIIVYMPKDAPGGTDTVLASFLTANYPAINRLLLKTRQDK